MITADDLVVTAQEVINYMSLRDLSGPQLVATEQVIAGVQGGLEDHLGRPVSIRQFTELAIVDRHTNVAYTQQTPVVEIITRVESLGPGGAVPGGVVGMVDTFGVPTDILGMSDYYMITYRAGIDGKNDESIRLKVMEVASRYISTHHDDVLTASNDVARRVQQPPIRYWEDEELSKFDRKRRRTMV